MQVQHHQYITVVVLTVHYYSSSSVNISSTRILSIYYCATTVLYNCSTVCSHCTTSSTVLNTVHGLITCTSQGTHDRIRGEIKICLLLLLLSCCPSRKEEGGRQLDSCDSPSLLLWLWNMFGRREWFRQYPADGYLFQNTKLLLLWGLWFTIFSFP